MINFGQAVERDPVVEMMDVMVANIPAEPCHDGAGLKIAGGIKGGLFKCPARLVVVYDAGEIVLGIKKVAAQGAAQHARKNQGQQHRPPAGEKHQSHRQPKMQ